MNFHVGTALLSEEGISVSSEYSLGNYADYLCLLWGHIVLKTIQAKLQVHQCLRLERNGPFHLHSVPFPQQ